MASLSKTVHRRHLTATNIHTQLKLKDDIAVKTFEDNENTTTAMFPILINILAFFALKYKFVLEESIVILLTIR